MDLQNRVLRFDLSAGQDLAVCVHQKVVIRMSGTFDSNGNAIQEIEISDEGKLKTKPDNGVVSPSVCNLGVSFGPFDHQEVLKTPSPSEELLNEELDKNKSQKVPEISLNARNPLLFEEINQELDHIVDEMDHIVQELIGVVAEDKINAIKVHDQQGEESDEDQELISGISEPSVSDLDLARNSEEDVTEGISSEIFPVSTDSLDSLGVEEKDSKESQRITVVTPEGSTTEEFYEQGREYFGSGSINLVLGDSDSETNIRGSSSETFITSGSNLDAFQELVECIEERFDQDMQYQSGFDFGEISNAFNVDLESQVFEIPKKSQVQDLNEIRCQLVQEDMREFLEEENYLEDFDVERMEDDATLEESDYFLPEIQISESQVFEISNEEESPREMKYEKVGKGSSEKQELEEPMKFVHEKIVLSPFGRALDELEDISERNSNENVSPVDFKSSESLEECDETLGFEKETQNEVDVNVEEDEGVFEEQDRREVVKSEASNENSFKVEDIARIPEVVEAREAIDEIVEEALEIVTAKKEGEAKFEEEIVEEARVMVQEIIEEAQKKSEEIKEDQADKPLTDNANGIKEPSDVNLSEFTKICLVAEEVISEVRKRVEEVENDEQIQSQVEEICVEDPIDEVVIIEEVQVIVSEVVEEVNVTIESISEEPSQEDIVEKRPDSELLAKLEEVEHHQMKYNVKSLEKLAFKAIQHTDSAVVSSVKAPNVKEDVILEDEFNLSKHTSDLGSEAYLVSTLNSSIKTIEDFNANPAPTDQNQNLEIAKELVENWLFKSNGDEIIDISGPSSKISHVDLIEDVMSESDELEDEEFIESRFREEDLQKFQASKEKLDKFFESLDKLEEAMTQEASSKVVTVEEDMKVEEMKSNPNLTSYPTMSEHEILAAKVKSRSLNPKELWNVNVNNIKEDLQNEESKRSRHFWTKYIPACFKSPEDAGAEARGTSGESRHPRKRSFSIGARLRRKNTQN